MQKILKMRSRVSPIIIMLAFAFACSESYLDQKPLGVLDEVALTNKNGVEQVLIGAYSMLDGYNLDNVNVWAANPVNWVFGSVPSDDAYKGSESTDDPGGFAQTEAYQWTPSMINLNDKFVANYEGAKRSTAVLTILKGVTTFDPNNPNDVIRQASIEGEAKFLRAFFHFELYKVFTNIPYFREEDYASLETLKKSNVGVDVLEECVTDVKEAIALLPETQEQKGRVTKFAAMAFLGKLYMYQAQPANGSTTLDPAKLALAKAQFDLVLPQYQLAACYRENFQVATENNPESIFSVQSASGNQARDANWLNQLAYPHGGGAATGCCGFHQPSQNLVNAYRVDDNGLPLNDNSSNTNPGAADKVDPRIDFNVGRNDVPFYDWGTHATTWVRSPDYGGQYNNKKYMPYKNDAVPGGGWNGPANNTINIQLIRLADVMLMLAECEVEIGSLDRAEDLVNEIRIRAGNCAQGLSTNAGSASITNNIDDAAITWADYEIAPYPDGTFAADKDAAREMVRLERRLELALEGHRFFDLKRWGFTYASTVLNNYVAVEKARRSYLAGAATFSEKNMSFPLPTVQVQLSKVGGETMLQQNEGY
jgi:starch-binding outer membrane protein, SusD/RagB family